MNNEELKDALLRGYAVVCEDPVHGTILYDKVTGILYRKGDGGKIAVSAEVQNAFCNSISIVRPEFLRKARDYECLSRI